MSGDVRITVDGEKVLARADEQLLEVLRRNSIEVPTLCFDPRLPPYGGCRLCVVARRDGRVGLVPACSTPVQEGMIIETMAPDVLKARRTQIEMLTAFHRFDCPVCERSGDCRLQDAVNTYGGLREPVVFERQDAGSDKTPSFIARDSSRCILCGKCVRLCEEVQGVAAIGLVGRGLQTRVETFLDEPLDCEFCGQCVNACPVAALSATPYQSQVPFWLRTEKSTTCSFCSCGCQLTMEVDGNELLRVNSDVEELPNHGKLCVKGWLGWDVLSHPERISAPRLRREGQLVEVSWDEALDTVAAALSKARLGSQRLAAIGSARLTCEDAYALQRLFRAGFGSPHVSSGLSGGIRALENGLVGVLNHPRSSAGFDELAKADVVLIVGADPGNTHPLVKTELVQGSLRRGQKVLIAHGLSGGPLDRLAEMKLAVNAGSEPALLRCIARAILELSPVHKQALRRVQGSQAWLDSLSAYGAETVQRIVGIDEDAVRSLAMLLIRAAKVVIVVPTGLGLPVDETELARAAAHLVGLLERRADLMILGEMANLQGVVDVGLSPVLLPGFRRADRYGNRQELKRVWNVDSVPGSGWGARELLSQAADEGFGALYLLGQDLIGSWPRSYGARGALERSNFVVCHEAFLTETALRSDVVLPVAVLAERRGSVVGCDGVQRTVMPTLTAPPGIPSDGQILAEIARRADVAFPSESQLENEMCEVVRWPIEKPRLVRYVAAPPPEVAVESPEGMLIDASPRLAHSGAVTTKSSTLASVSPRVAAWVNPADAGDLGLQNGDVVAVRRGGGELLLRARFEESVRRGTVVVPWHGSPDGAASLADEVDIPMFGELRRTR